jgi:hypothetical protein
MIAGLETSARTAIEVEQPPKWPDPPPAGHASFVCKGPTLQSGLEFTLKETGEVFEVTTNIIGDRYTARKK